MRSITKSSLALMTTLGLAGNGFADSLLQADCATGSKRAVLQLASSGKGSVAIVDGDSNYSCNLQLSAVEGPPFSDNATGMLVLDLSKVDCAPSAAERQLQRTLALHIADPKLASREASAIIERRTGVFQCQVKQMDKDGLEKLYTELSAAK